MSEEKDQDVELEPRASDIEGEVVDAEVTEVERPSEEKVQEKTATGPGRLPVFALVLAILALLVTGVGLGYAYQYWQGMQKDLMTMRADLESASDAEKQLREKLQATEQAFAETKKGLATQQQTLQAQDKKLEQERQKLQKQGAEMQQTLESVYQRVGRNSTAWMAAEAEYLLNVANHRLHLEHDPSTAVAALQAADQRLRDTGDPGWVKVREQIAEEITRVRAVGELDRAGISAKLVGMSRTVQDLKLSGTEPQPSVQEAGEKPQKSTGEKNLKTLLKDSWEGFKSVMVIRHHGKPVTAMLPPDQQFFVLQNLRLKFESARMAMLRGDQGLYDASLTLAVEWLKDFFETDDQRVEALRTQIAELQKLKINPALPDISASLVALHERMKQGSNGETAQ